MPTIRRSLIASIFALIAATGAAHAEFDQTGTVATADVLPGVALQGANYSIAPQAINTGALVRYTLSVSGQDYPIVGTDLLLLRLKELKALEVMVKTESSDTFKDSAERAIKAPVEGAVGLVTSPVDTVSDFVSGVGSFFENVGHAAVGKSSEEEEGVFKSVVGYGAARRGIAKAFNIDPYTSFPPLKEKLSDLSWAATGGSFAINIAFGAIPGKSGTAVKGLGSVHGFGSLVYDKSPADLKDSNENRLEQMKVPNNVIRAFLNHPQYTPTYTTEIVADLAAMPIYNRGAFISRALLVEDPNGAFFMMRWARAYRAYHHKIKPIYQFVRLGLAPLAQREDGVLIAVIPSDQFLWTQEIASRHLGNMKDLTKIKGVTGGELWFAGPVSATARAKFEEQGWVVKDNQGATLGLR